MKILLILLLGPALAQDDPSEAGKKALEQLAEIEQGNVRITAITVRATALQEEARKAADEHNDPRIKELEEEFSKLKADYTKLAEDLRKKMDVLTDFIGPELEKSKTDWALLDVRGKTQLLKGELKPAVESFKEVLKQKPERVSTNLRMAQALQGLSLYEESLKSLEVVLKAKPNDNEALVFQALCLFSLDRFGEADKLLQALRKKTLLPQYKPIVERTAESCTEYLGFHKAEVLLREKEKKADDLPRVRFKTSKGEIVIELFENEAPNTVANFVSLVAKGFYDATRFHRVLPDFMAQGGDPNSKDENPANDGQGGPGYAIADEMPGDTFRKHFRGSLSMANTGPNTNGSQFFLTHKPTPWLNGRHTVFGRVIQGLDVIVRLEKGDTLEKAEVIRKRDHEYTPEKHGR